jgi:hypothetical protein
MHKKKITFRLLVLALFLPDHILFSEEKLNYGFGYSLNTLCSSFTNSCPYGAKELTVEKTIGQRFTGEVQFSEINVSKLQPTLLNNINEVDSYRIHAVGFGGSVYFPQVHIIPTSIFASTNLGSGEKISLDHKENAMFFSQNLGFKFKFEFFEKPNIYAELKTFISHLETRSKKSHMEQFLWIPTTGLSFGYSF